MLSVLAFHAFPSFLPGGFVGVDIFFVISGFLITTIILKSLDDNGFSYRNFYARRIKRILPALILVVVATFAIGWHVLLPRDLAQLGEHVAAAAGFASNFLLWNEAGYFDTAAETKPLLHLWSLAIEEQFYLVWPVLLGIAWRRRWRLVVVVALLALTSFAANVLFVSIKPTATFYLPASRFWELMVGGMLACVHLHSPQHPVGARAHVMSIAGLALVFAALILVSPNAAFPGWWALLPVVGAALCIAAGPGGLVNRAFLGSRPLMWIGLISYPLYLWHWPLLVYARMLDVGQGHWSVRAGVLGVSFVLAVATYRLFERPIRWGVGQQRARILGLSTAMVLIFVVGIAAMASGGFGSRLRGTSLAFASHDYDFVSDARVGKCWVSLASAPDSYTGECAGISREKVTILVWGDSHAARFVPGLRAILGPAANIGQFTRDSCPGVLHFGLPNCVDANAYVMEQIKKIRPRTVILFGAWTQYVSPIGSLKTTDLLATADALHGAGVERIVLMGPAPRWKDSLPANLVKLHAQHVDASIPTMTKFGLTEEASRTDAMLQEMASSLPGVEYFSTYGAMCTDDGCLTHLDNSPEGLTTWDYGHLTTSGATFVAKRLVDWLTRDRRDGSLGP